MTDLATAFNAAAHVALVNLIPTRAPLACPVGFDLGHPPAHLVIAVSGNWYGSPARVGVKRFAGSALGADVI